MITNNPLDFLWKSFPSTVDFFSDKPPVKDDPSVPKPLKIEESEARRHYFILTTVGVWLAALPIQVRTVASVAVYWVRWKERYGPSALSLICFVANLAKAFVGLAWHLISSPRFFLSETHFRKPPWSSRNDARAWGFPIRPLFGWTWVVAFLIVVILPAIDVMTLFFGDPVTKSVLFTATILTFGLPIAFPWKLATLLFKELGISQGLLRGFQLKRRLFDLFEDDVVDPTNNKEMHALLVSAAFQQQDQVWPNKDYSVVKGLLAALAIPGIFPPERVAKRDLVNYTAVDEHALLVDGVAVRTNPLPAFLRWCTFHENDAALLKDPERRRSVYVIARQPNLTTRTE
jgi:hypothetical protein